MKNRIKIAAATLAIALFALPLMACSMGKAEPVSALSPAISELKTITASGQGTVIVEPDIANITLGITTKNEKAAKAAEENANEMTKIIDAVKKAGLKDDEISTSGYTINSVYDYSRETPVFTGYQVMNTLNLKVNDISKVAEILDTAVAAGANEVQGVYFSVKDSKEQYAKALELAVANALSKAEVLAEAAGIKGKLVVHNMSESVDAYAYDTMYAMKEASAAGNGAPTPIMPAGQTIVAKVTITYTFNG